MRQAHSIAPMTAPPFRTVTGAVDLMKAIRYRSPWPRHPFADGGHAGDKLKDALSGHGQWTIEIIGCSDTAEGFEVLPREWVVERTFAWLGGCRRLARDWERSIESSTAWATIAHIRILARRLARLLSYLNNFSVRLSLSTAESASLTGSRAPHNLPSGGAAQANFNIKRDISLGSVDNHRAATSIAQRCQLAA